MTTSRDEDGRSDPQVGRDLRAEKRAPWTPPRLVDYGSIRNLVRAGSANVADGPQGMMMNP